MGRLCCRRQSFVIEDTNVCPMETEQNLKGIDPEGEWSDFCGFVLVCFDTFLEDIVLLDRRTDMKFIEV